MDQWYVAPPGGNTEGPYTTEDLVVKIRRGSVDRESQVCNANGSVWVVMADVPEFERALRRAPTILKAPGAFQPSKPPPAQSSPRAASAPPAAASDSAPQARKPFPRPPAAPIRAKVSQPPAGADRAKVSHPPMAPVRAQSSQPPPEVARSKLTDPPEPVSEPHRSKLTDPPEPVAAGPLPAMPPLGPPRRDEAEDTIPPPAAQPAPAAAPAPEPSVPPSFEIAPEPSAEVDASSPQDSTRTDETVPGRGRRAQPASSLPWLVTGAGIFVLLIGAIITLAANSLKGTVIMLLGLGAISVGGQLDSGSRQRD